MGYQCPKCQSENIRKVSEIYKEGVQTGNMTHGGGGEVRNSMVTTISAAAQEMAPPSISWRTKTDWIRTKLIGTVLFFPTIFGIILVLNPDSSSDWIAGKIMGVVFLIVGVGGYYIATVVETKKKNHYELNVYPALRAKWERMWKCNRCGEFFSDEVFKEAA